MIKCTGCGKELEDGATFCDNCGTPVSAAPTETPQTVENVFCTNCGAQIPAGDAFCPNCGANTVTGGMSGRTGAMGRNSSPVKTKKAAAGINKIGIIVGGVAAVLLVALLVAVFVRKTEKPGYFFYIKDEEVLYAETGKKETVQITDHVLDEDEFDNSYFLTLAEFDFLYLFKRSNDGKLVFFPEKMNSSGYTLYYKKLSGSNQKAEKIASGVEAYSLNTSATLVTYLDANNNLYSYNVKKADRDKIASDISKYRVSEDGKTVYFLNAEGTLYLWKLGKDKEKIDSGVTRVCYSTDDYKTIYYLKDDTFYKKTDGKSKEKIASNVVEVLKVYESGAAYFIKDNTDEQYISDFLKDDLAEADWKMTEPEWPDSPIRSQYGSDTAYNAAVTDYNKAREEYDEKYKEYEQKLYRDYLREELEDNPSFELERYELYYYDGKDDIKITEGLVGQYQYNVATDTEVIVYAAMDTDSFDKVKLSQLENIYDIYSLESEITRALAESAQRYVAIKEKEQTLEAESGQNFVISADGDRIMFLDDVDEEKSTADLYEVKINNGKLSSPELYDSDIYTGSWSLGFAKNEGPHYFKDYKDGGDLYIGEKLVDSDVYRYGMYYDEESGKIYYMTDFSSEDGEGTLKEYKNGKAEEIAEDVADYVVVDGNVYYLTDYSQKSHTGELYQYGGKEKQIDDDVVTIIDTVSYKEMQGLAFWYCW